MEKLIIPVLAGILVSSLVYSATFNVKDDTKDDTQKEVEKVETVTTTATTTISISEEIKAMEHDQADIESILQRFNSHKDLYNEAITADAGTKLKTISAATCSFPTLPEVVEE